MTTSHLKNWKRFLRPLNFGNNMKKILPHLLSFTILSAILIMMAVKISQVSDEVEKLKKGHQKETPTTDTLKTAEVETPATPSISDWELMKLAIIDIESKGNDNAHNTNGDCLGCMQLTPIYVAECNRLSGHEKYSMHDRLSRHKSLEMFEVINKHHNPKKDIHKAIHLHNPRGGDAYKNRVLRKMEEMRDCF